MAGLGDTLSTFSTDLGTLRTHDALHQRQQKVAQATRRLLQSEDMVNLLQEAGIELPSLAELDANKARRTPTGLNYGGSRPGDWRTALGRTHGPAAGAAGAPDTISEVAEGDGGDPGELGGAEGGEASTTGGGVSRPTTSSGALASPPKSPSKWGTSGAAAVAVGRMGTIRRDTANQAREEEAVVERNPIIRRLKKLKHKVLFGRVGEKAYSRYKATLRAELCWRDILRPNLSASRKLDTHSSWLASAITEEQKRAVRNEAAQVIQAAWRKFRKARNGAIMKHIKDYELGKFTDWSDDESVATDELPDWWGDESGSDDDDDEEGGGGGKKKKKKKKEAGGKGGKGAAKKKKGKLPGVDAGSAPSMVRKKAALLAVADDMDEDTMGEVVKAARKKREAKKRKKRREAALARGEPVSESEEESEEEEDEEDEEEDEDEEDDEEEEEEEEGGNRASKWKKRMAKKKSMTGEGLGDGEEGEAGSPASPSRRRGKGSPKRGETGNASSPRKGRGRKSQSEIAAPWDDGEGGDDGADGGAGVDGEGKPRRARRVRAPGAGGGEGGEGGEEGEFEEGDEGDFEDGEWEGEVGEDGQPSPTARRRRTSQAKAPADGSSAPGEEGTAEDDGGAGPSGARGSGTGAGPSGQPGTSQGGGDAPGGKGKGKKGAKGKGGKGKKGGRKGGRGGYSSGAGGDSEGARRKPLVVNHGPPQDWSKVGVHADLFEAATDQEKRAAILARMAADEGPNWRPTGVVAAWHEASKLLYDGDDVQKRAEAMAKVAAAQVAEGSHVVWRHAGGPSGWGTATYDRGLYDGPPEERQRNTVNPLGPVWRPAGNAGAGFTSISGGYVSPPSPASSEDDGQGGTPEERAARRAERRAARAAAKEARRLQRLAMAQAAVDAAAAARGDDLGAEGSSSSIGNRLNNRKPWRFTYAPETGDAVSGNAPPASRTEHITRDLGRGGDVPWRYTVNTDGSENAALNPYNMWGPYEDPENPFKRAGGTMARVPPPPRGQGSDEDATDARTPRHRSAANRGGGESSDSDTEGVARLLRPHPHRRSRAQAASTTAIPGHILLDPYSRSYAQATPDEAAAAIRAVADAAERLHARHSGRKLEGGLAVRGKSAVARKHQAQGGGEDGDADGEGEDGDADADGEDELGEGEALGDGGEGGDEEGPDAATVDALKSLAEALTGMLAELSSPGQAETGGGEAEAESAVRHPYDNVAVEDMTPSELGYEPSYSRFLDPEPSMEPSSYTVRSGRSYGGTYTGPLSPRRRAREYERDRELRAKVDRDRSPLRPAACSAAAQPPPPKRVWSAKGSTAFTAGGIQPFPLEPEILRGLPQRLQNTAPRPKSLPGSPRGSYRGSIPGLTGGLTGTLPYPPTFLTGEPSGFSAHNTSNLDGGMSSYSYTYGFGGTGMTGMSTSSLTFNQDELPPLPAILQDPLASEFLATRGAQILASRRLAAKGAAQPDPRALYELLFLGPRVQQQRQMEFRGATVAVGAPAEAVPPPPPPPVIGSAAVAAAVGAAAPPPPGSPRRRAGPAPAAGTAAAAAQTAAATGGQVKLPSTHPMARMYNMHGVDPSPYGPYTWSRAANDPSAPLGETEPRPGSPPKQPSPMVLLQPQPPPLQLSPNVTQHRLVPRRQASRIEPMNGGSPTLQPLLEDQAFFSPMRSPSGSLLPGLSSGQTPPPPPFLAPPSPLPALPAAPPWGPGSPSAAGLPPLPPGMHPSADLLRRSMPAGPLAPPPTAVAGSWPGPGPGPVAYSQYTFAAGDSQPAPPPTALVGAAPPVAALQPPLGSPSPSPGLRRPPSAEGHVLAKPVTPPTAALLRTSVDLGSLPAMVAAAAAQQQQQQHQQDQGSPGDRLPAVASSSRGGSAEKAGRAGRGGGGGTDGVGAQRLAAEAWPAAPPEAGPAQARPGPAYTDGVDWRGEVYDEPSGTLLPPLQPPMAAPPAQLSSPTYSAAAAATAPQSLTSPVSGRPHKQRRGSPPRQAQPQAVQPSWQAQTPNGFKARPAGGLRTFAGTQAASLGLTKLPAVAQRQGPPSPMVATATAAAMGTGTLPAAPPGLAVEPSYEGALAGGASQGSLTRRRAGQLRVGRAPLGAPLNWRMPERPPE